jgi:predicted DNA-binding transcriptional regulator YafY
LSGVIGCRYAAPTACSTSSAFLRAASQPVTAAAIADELKVTVRTVYRDVATLQARRIPIEGAAGVGYGLRRGYELRPLMFTEDEAEAIAVDAGLLFPVR